MFSLSYFDGEKKPDSQPTDIRMKWQKHLCSDQNIYPIVAHEIRSPYSEIAFVGAPASFRLAGRLYRGGKDETQSNLTYTRLGQTSGVWPQVIYFSHI